MHAFLGAAGREFRMTCAAVGGVADHVHMLLSLTATTRLADVMRGLKPASSTRVHQNFGLSAFAWQDGHEAFGVNAKDLGPSRTYIADQAENHRRHNFREEYVALLRRSGVRYDERYLD